MFNWNQTLLRASAFSAAVFVFMFTTSLIFPFMNKVLPLTITKIAGIESCCSGDCGCGIIETLSDSCCCAPENLTEASCSMGTIEDSCCSEETVTLIEEDSCCSEETLLEETPVNVDYLSMLQCQGYDESIEMSMSFKATLTAPFEAVIFPPFKTSKKWSTASFGLNSIFTEPPLKVPIFI